MVVVKRHSEHVEEDKQHDNHVEFLVCHDPEHNGLRFPLKDNERNSTQLRIIINRRTRMIYKGVKGSKGDTIPELELKGFFSTFEYSVPLHPLTPIIQYWGTLMRANFQGLYPSDTRKFSTDKPFNSDFYSKRGRFWTDNAINWPKCLYMEEPISPNTVFTSVSYFTNRDKMYFRLIPWTCQLESPGNHGKQPWICPHCDSSSYSSRTFHTKNRVP